MKKHNFRLVPVITSLVLILFSCSNDNSPSSNNPQVTEGNWKVSYYFDNTDETSDFNQFVFNFNPAGTITATETGGSVVAGTWSETSTKLILDFGTHPVLMELSDDWLKEEKTNTSIKLKEDNPAQDDRLQFTKL